VARSPLADACLASPRPTSPEGGIETMPSSFFRYVAQVLEAELQAWMAAIAFWFGL